MKILKSFNYKGYKINISGSFEDRVSPQVHVQLFIYGKNMEVIYKHFVNTCATRKKKLLFWTIEHPATLKENVEWWINEYENRAKSIIDSKLYEKEITEGMLGTLDNIN